MISTSGNNVNFYIRTDGEIDGINNYLSIQMQVEPFESSRIKNSMVFSLEGEARNEDKSIYTFGGDIILNDEKKHNLIKMFRLMADFLEDK